MEKQLIDGLIIDRSIVSIKEIIFNCYKNNPKSLEVIIPELQDFYDLLYSLKSE